MSDDKNNNIIKDDLLGNSEWKQSKVGYLTGYSAIKKSAFNTVSAPLEYGNSFLKAIRTLIFRKREKTYLSDINDSKQRFSSAMDYYGRSEADITRLTKQTHSTFILYGIFSFLSIVWGMYQMSSSYFSGTLFSYLFSIFPFFIVFPLFLKYYYWYSQLKERDLFSFSTFLSRHSHLGKIGLYLFIMSILAVPSTAFAFSVTNTLPDTDLFLRMVQMIAPIGAAGIGVDGLSPWAEPIGYAFQAFNVALMTVGSLMLGWQTIAGTVASAYEGEVLGQRWHTIWAPLRVVSGVGSLAPIANGYCFAQLLVIQIMIWGGGIANDVWGAYVNFYKDNQASLFTQEAVFQDSDIRGNSGITALAANAEARAFILGALEKEVCLAGFRKMFTHYIDEYNRTAATPVDLDTELAKGVNSDVFRSANGFNSGLHWVFGTTASGGSFDPIALTSGTPAFSIRPVSDLLAWANDPVGIMNGDRAPTTGAIWNYGEACGEVQLNYQTVAIITEQFDTIRNESDPTISEAQLTNLVSTVDSINSQGATLINAQVLPAIRAAANMVVDAYGTFDPVSRTVLPQNLEPRGPAEIALGNAYMDYKEIIRQSNRLANQEIFNSYAGVDKNKIFGAIEEKGWAASGSFYVLLARIQAQANSLNTVLPYVSDLNYYRFISSLDGLFNDSDALSFFDGSDAAGASTQGQVGLFPGLAMFVDSAILDNGDTVEAQLFNEIDEPGLITEMIRYISGDFYDYFFEELTNVDPFNAMLDLAEMGRKLMNWLGMIYAIFVLGSVISGVAGGLMSFLQKMDFTGTTSAITGGIQGFLGAMDGIVFIIKALLFMIFGIAIVHLFILPMFPYVIMTFFVMGMLVLVAEALIAAPIWAFFHVRLDGNDFVDQVQKPGYMIAFNLLLRPTLAIFGLILSYTIFGAIIWFTNETFGLAGKSVLLGGSNIIGVFVMGAIITYIHYQVAIRSFTLITQIPDRVTRWFGQGGENLGEQSDAEKSTSMIVGGVVSRTEGLARSAGLASSIGGSRGGGAPSAENQGKGGASGKGGAESGGDGGSVSGSK